MRCGGPITPDRVRPESGLPVYSRKSRSRLTFFCSNQGVDVMSALNVTQLWLQAAAGGGGAGGSQLPNGTQAALTQEQQESVAKMSKVDKEQTLRLLCVDGWLTQVRAFPMYHTSPAGLPILVPEGTVITSALTCLSIHRDIQG